MKKVFDSRSDHSEMKVRGRNTRNELCFKVFWTRQDGSRGYGFHYLTFDEVAELADALEDWMDDVEDRRIGGCPYTVVKPDLFRDPLTCSHMLPSGWCTVHDVDLSHCHDTCFVCPRFDGRRDQCRGCRTAR